MSDAQVGEWCDPACVRKITLAGICRVALDEEVVRSKLGQLFYWNGLDYGNERYCGDRK